MQPEYSDFYTKDDTDVEVRVDYFEDRETNAFITIGGFVHVQASPVQLQKLHDLIGEVLVDWSEMNPEEVDSE